MSDASKVFADVLRNKVREYPTKAHDVAIARRFGRILGVKGTDYLDQVLPSCPAQKAIILDREGGPPTLGEFDVVLVGCPGIFDRADTWRKAIRNYVERGGHLVTTDWCLQNLIEDTFPATIRRSGTASGSYPIRICEKDHPYLQGISDAGGTSWEVEVASHPIEILDHKRVVTLLDAPGMGKHPAVMVNFACGAGQVTHAISHFHLQGGGDRGKYVSAYIVTNIIEEAVAKRVTSPRGSVRGVAAANSPATPPAPPHLRPPRLRLTNPKPTRIRFRDEGASS